MGRNRVDVAKEFYYEPFNRKFNQNQTIAKQVRRERMYWRVLMETSIARFKWTGLPNTVDERFLEKTLFEQGLVVFFKSTKFDKFIALRGTPSGQLNMYDNPTSFTVLGNQQISTVLSASDCVPIWSSISRIPDVDMVMIFSEQLASLDRTIEITTNNMRQSRIIVADENQRMSFENFNRQIEEGASAIFTTNNRLAENVTVHDMGVDPRNLPALIEARTKIWSQCMMLLGLNHNPGEDKTERLVSNEVDANNEQVSVRKNAGLLARRQACEIMNRRYGLDVSVDFDTEGAARSLVEFEAMAPDVTTGKEVE